MNIRDLIDGAVRKSEEEYQKKEKTDKLRPHTFGQCLRRQYYFYKGEPETNPKDDRTRRVLYVGTFFHKLIQDLAIAKYPDALIEEPVEDLYISGKADIVHEEEVVDIKTQHSYAFHHMKDKLIADARPEACLQIMAYATRLNKDFARLSFISKDDLCIAEYCIPVTAEWAEKVETEIATLNEMRNKDWFPPAVPRLYGLDSKKKPKECEMYCNWKNKCQGECDGNNKHNTKT